MSAGMPRPAIQPKPTVWEFERVPLSDGSIAVRIDIYSDSGVQHVFLPAGGAANVGKQLIELGTGLILPNGTGS